MISGSREATTQKDREKLMAEIAKYNPTHILHGGAKGADMIAHHYAQINKLPETIKLPNYGTHGKNAPHLRNDELIQLADKVICYYATNYPTKTPGTASVAEKAKKAGKLLAEVWRSRETAETQTSLF